MHGKENMPAEGFALKLRTQQNKGQMEYARRKHMNTIGEYSVWTIDLQK